MASATSSEHGWVGSLWRYPVKSMMGEELNAAEVGARGLAGDEAYALVDRSDGKVATAKNPRKWPTLFDFRATFVETPRADASMPAVKMTLPDGNMVRSDQGDRDRILSRVLGREVALEAIGPGSSARTARRQ